MRVVPKNKVIYSFDPANKPTERVKIGEPILLRTEDAFGGQVKSDRDSVETLDWSKLDGATGPVFVENAKHGDTLIVEILDISIEKKGVMATIPKQGALPKRRFKPFTKIVEMYGDRFCFDHALWLRINPMIGTIGVTPTASIPTGSLGRHGGNMDVKDLTMSTKLYLPVFVDGALFAAGDLHAVQADGELCVTAVEVAGEILIRFNLIKGRKPEWPILETKNHYSILTCGKTLDEAARLSTEAVVESLMREYDWSFEEAYMFGSLAVNLKINQVVDPKKGVRAVISKDLISLDSILT